MALAGLRGPARWWLSAAAVVALAGGPPGSAGPSPPPPPAVVHVGLSDGSTAGRVPRLLGGQDIILQVAAAPRRPVLWQFGALDTVLAQGAVIAGDDGAARVRLTMPAVRVRTPCLVWVWSSGAEASHAAIVFPTTMLAEAAARLRGRRLAVLEDTGRVGRALEAEGVAFTAVQSDIEKTFFEADLILVACYEKGGPSARPWAVLEPRVRRGACLVVLNPPVGWAGWGLRRVELAEPAEGWVRLAPRFPVPLDPADLGVGPWAAALEAEAGAQSLVWLEPLPGGTGESAPAAAPLLAAGRLVGRGRVVVALAPGLERPDTDAIGRALLDGLILWSLEPDEDPSRT
ncbi:MAG: hypothetical protein IMZ66_07735 [Planctomycetes bacterium]|nr:hypothetical protein [Planctomycetota bacterium]